MKISNPNKFMFFSILYYIFIAPILFSQILKLTYKYISSSVFNIFLSSIILNLVPTIFFFLITKSNIKNIIPFKKLSKKSVILVILITFFSMPISSLISYITSIFFSQDVSSMIIEESLNNSFLTMIISVCIVPSILEELLCRGVYLSSFKKENLIKSCIMCGLFFGIMHFNWEQFFYATFMGTIFALLVKITGSIYSSMIAHFIINAHSVSLIFLLSPIYKLLDFNVSEIISQTENKISFLITLNTFILSTIVGIIALYFLFKRLIKENNPDLNNNTNNNKLIDKYFVLSIILYLTYMLIHPLI